MSSKRGRKRNDNLPPNRARDVQRAFRARRAAHLQALEERVSELEEENDHLRAALNLPPATRPPLGRGPTGKDRVKTFGSRASTHQGDPSLGESSSSPGTSTSSPQSSSITMSSVVNPGEGDGVGGTWDHALTMPQQDDYPDRDAVHSGGHTTVPSVSAFSPEPHFRFDVAPTSSSRSSISGALFASPASSNYPHTSDRPTTSSSTFSRDEPFSFSTPPLAPGHASPHTFRGFASPSAPQHSHQITTALSGGGAHSPMAPHSSHAQPSGAAYSLRRSITEPQQFPTYVETYPHAPYPQQAHSIPQQSIRLSSVTSRLPPNHPGTSRPGYAGSGGSAGPSTTRTT